MKQTSEDSKTILNLRAELGEKLALNPNEELIEDIEAKSQ